MGRIITINNLKGGCGKTTTVQTMAGCLSERGYKCLVVDLDPSANLTFSSNIHDAEYTIYDFMKGRSSFDETRQLNKYYDIIPGGLKLNRADQEFRDTDLRSVLDPIKSNYDYILLDTPSKLGAIFRNSLAAADYVIIPVEPSFYSFQGLQQFFDTIKETKQQLNSNLQILGLLLVRFKEKETVNRILQFLMNRSAKEQEAQLFGTYIHESCAVSEAQGLQENIIVTSPKSRTSIDYRIFTDEVLDLLQDNRLRKII